MRLYEGLFIVQPDLNEAKKSSVFAQIEAPITKQGGTIETAQEWGRRTLAYPIRKKREGVYYLIRFHLDPKTVSALRKEYSLNDAILGSLITHVNG